MDTLTNKRKRGNYLWHIAAMLAACSALYYLPAIASLAGWTSLHDVLSPIHNLYGIDFYVILFFAPVVYAAYVYGINGSLLTAFTAMLILVPYSVLIDTYPNALFKPTAFAIILSAVGAAVAILQRSDEERRRSMSELKCLYDIGKAAAESSSVEGFISSAIKLIPQAMAYPDEAHVRITVRDMVFQSPGFEETRSRIDEELALGDEVLGNLEIYTVRSDTRMKRQDHLTRTLAERISGAIHSIELEHSLKGYYGQLEEMVEKRTRDLEQIQEKLVRSERLAAVGELASGVGHELRNPLNVIRNCVYLLHMTLAEKADEEAADTLKVLDKQIDIANRIVTDLLDFTRIKPPTLTSVDLNSLVKECLSWITVPEDIAVSTSLDGSAPRISADAEQIGRAFANFISNATQAMNGKGGELKVSTGTEDGAAWVRFEDNGCGIPPENMGKIFEPLFTTKPKGIGLGLAITRRLIEQHSGTIEVKSQVGKGTTFTVRLPIQKGNEN
ncbi:MAG: ATP-binding protein [Chloroflexota bacterium]